MELQELHTKQPDLIGNTMKHRGALNLLLRCRAHKMPTLDGMSGKASYVKKKEINNGYKHHCSLSPDEKKRFLTLHQQQENTLNCHFWSSRPWVLFSKHPANTITFGMTLGWKYIYLYVLHYYSIVLGVEMHDRLDEKKS